MSGTDGKLFRDYTSGSPTETACDMLYLQTQLASPKPDVVDQIDVDDVLDIGLSNLNGQLVAVALWQGHLAGALRLREYSGSSHASKAVPVTERL